MTAAKHPYTARELGIRFALWAEARRTPPRCEAVMTRFECSRATAHRLIGEYFDAKGVARPRMGRAA